MFQHTFVHMFLNMLLRRCIKSDTYEQTSLKCVVCVDTHVNKQICYLNTPRSKCVDKQIVIHMNNNQMNQNKS